jgi:hypothetical protein
MSSLMFETSTTVLLFSIFIVISRQSEETNNVWRMIPDDPHRVVEENSVLSITCTYAFRDDDSTQHRNVVWKWELPDFLTKYPQVNI